MKVKQISDSTLKITIQLEDLEERGMEIADFLIPQEKTEEFFYTVLDELDLPMTFRESGMLSFRVTRIYRFIGIRRCIKNDSR